ncbi:hypothetical protein F1880_009160 [Penicillium rolfsii]|nr:hypothetical protein F1880_009160 [Penicillium rolfsii]
MSETFQELADIPKDFVREGSLFIRRCTKPDKREFIKISQAVGMGFLVMGAIGYFVKLSKYSLKIIHYVSGDLSIEQTADLGVTTIVHIPVNQVLVGGA